MVLVKRKKKMDTSTEDTEEDEPPVDIAMRAPEYVEMQIERDESDEPSEEDVPSIGNTVHTKYNDHYDVKFYRLDKGQNYKQPDGSYITTPAPGIHPDRPIGYEDHFGNHRKGYYRKFRSAAVSKKEHAEILKQKHPKGSDLGKARGKIINIRNPNNYKTGVDQKELDLFKKLLPDSVGVHREVYYTPMVPITEGEDPTITHAKANYLAEHASDHIRKLGFPPEYIGVRSEMPSPDVDGKKIQIHWEKNHTKHSVPDWEDHVEWPDDFEPYKGYWAKKGGSGSDKRKIIFNPDPIYDPAKREKLRANKPGQEFAQPKPRKKKKKKKKKVKPPEQPLPPIEEEIMPAVQPYAPAIMFGDPGPQAEMFGALPQPLADEPQIVPFPPPARPKKKPKPPMEEPTEAEKKDFRTEELREQEELRKEYAKEPEAIKDPAFDLQAWFNSYRGDRDWDTIDAAHPWTAKNADKRVEKFMKAIFEYREVHEKGWKRGGWKKQHENIIHVALRSIAENNDNNLPQINSTELYKAISKLKRAYNYTKEQKSFLPENYDQTPGGITYWWKDRITPWLRDNDITEGPGFQKELGPEREAEAEQKVQYKADVADVRARASDPDGYTMSESDVEQQPRARRRSPTYSTTGDETDESDVEPITPKTPKTFKKFKLGPFHGKGRGKRIAHKKADHSKQKRPVVSGHGNIGKAPTVPADPDASSEGYVTQVLQKIRRGNIKLPDLINAGLPIPAAYQPPIPPPVVQPQPVIQQPARGRGRGRGRGQPPPVQAAIPVQPPQPVTENNITG